jgi:CMP-N,N'-diacetyllegionaminic acid synthase
LIVLLIGYGSIGKRHEEVLLSLKKIDTVDIVTKQILDDKTTFKKLEEVENLDSYDYFIIASETAKHFAQLEHLENCVKDKLIFCEKPLFKDNKKLEIFKNRVYIGYVLRFHPLLNRLKKLVENEILLSINVTCGQYLPTWRADVDYRDSYSAKKEQGGGVLLDLSHEIDYTEWLCGKIDTLHSYQVKVSDLEIDSDDLTTFIGQTINGTIVNMSIDYISKITYRRVIIHTLASTYELDFINNTLVLKDKNSKENIYKSESLERNSMFVSMHEAVLGNKKDLSTYEDGVSVMNTIVKIQEQNR